LQIDQPSRLSFLPSSPAPHGRPYSVALLVLGLLAVFGIGALVSLVASGPEPRSKWGYAAAALVLLLSTLQAAPPLALLSRLTTGYWGIPLRRAADLGGLSGVVTAPLGIVLLFALPDWSGRASIWLDWPGAPRLWDGIALVLLALLGLVLVYLNALPDLAAASRPIGLARRWRGGSHQWSVLSSALAIVGSLYLLLLIFVHLVVASDLAVSLVPGWKSADMPAYQITSALQGGLATVTVVLALVRRRAGALSPIGRDTFHALGKLVLTFSLFWFYFTWAEILTDWYGREPEAVAVLNLLYFGPYLLPFLAAAVLVFVIPLLLMLSNGARGSVAGPTIAAVCVLGGLVVDRVRLYVAAWSVAGPPTTVSLDNVPPVAQFPGLPDVLVFLGLPAAAAFVYLACLRWVPLEAGWELTARNLLQTTRAYGKRTVTVLAKPPHDVEPRTERRTIISALKLDLDLLWFVERTPRWFWLPTAVLGLLVLAAVVCVGLMIVFGLQITGYQNTVYWAVFITNFVFWVEISHAGVLMSAMLRLTMAQWRRPITRLAESMAIFGLLTAAIFPVIHTGRPWRVLYWIFPYDFSRGIWPNIRSPLVWDPSAIVTYLTATVLFVSLGLIPDLAALRDRSTGWRQKVYGLLALGFRGTARQWRIQHAANQLLSALVLPVFVSVTSIVAWDFSMATLPGWHSTAYAPFFVIGAVHSGIAAVVTAMSLLRGPLRLRDYFTPALYDTIGRLQLVVLLAYVFFFVTDFQFSLFDRDPVETSIWHLRLLEPPTSLLFYVYLVSAIALPLFVWTSHRRRRNIGLMFGTAIAVNIGEWIDHYLSVVTPENLKQAFVFTWVSVYQPKPVEYVITVGSVAAVALGVWLFAKVFPIVPLHPLKEGQVLRQQLNIGRAEIPAAVHED